MLLSACSTSWEGHKGDLLVIPPERHSLEALKDTIMVLTTAMVHGPTSLALTTSAVR